MKGDSKTLSGDAIKNKWPKKKQSLLQGWQINDYWNLLDEQGQNLKSDGAYSYNQTVRFSSSGETSVGDWTSNLNEWWGHFFDKSKWDISQTIQDIKGSWN